MITETRPTIALDDPALYFNRELSWLAFNDRVLSLAIAVQMARFHACAPPEALTEQEEPEPADALTGY